MATTEIRVTGYRYNMASWFTEKSQGVLEELAHMIDVVRQDSGVKEEVQSSLLSSLSRALHDATKLLAVSAGSEWKSHEHVALVLNGGYRGYEELAKEYGLIDETSEERERRGLAEFSDTILRLVDGPRSPNRTLVHEVLRETACTHPVVGKIEDLTERVTMGQLDWAEYAKQVRQLLFST